MRKDKRETDAYIQVWLERRYIATVQMLIAKYEITPAKHLSEVIRYALEVFVESAVDQGLIEFVSTTAEASNILSRFDVNLNPSRRGLQNLSLNLQRDVAGDDFNTSGAKTGRHASRFTQEDVDSMMKGELKRLEEEQGGPALLEHGEDTE